MHHNLLILAIKWMNESGPNRTPQLPDERVRRKWRKEHIDHHGSSSQPCQTWRRHPLWNSSMIPSQPSVSLLVLKWMMKMAGMQARTHFARPEWKEVFGRIASKHAYKTVGVFYCGMPLLAKELNALSLEFTRKTATRFEFHKEYFWFQQLNYEGSKRVLIVLPF